MYYYTRKEFDNYTRIFKNSVDMRFSLLKENIFLTNKKINSLTETLLYNKDVLDEMTIDEIVKDNNLIDNNSGKKLRFKIAEDLGQKNFKEITYRAIIFAFKYATVKNFFYGQYRKFLPEYDYDQIKFSEKTKAFFEATMKELDRLDDAISAMSSAVDIDEIPYKYMEYLASLIGYESEDKNLVKDYVFRDLIKNMIEVYRVKGTNYSFELFLSFLGFNVTIEEYWFDRRFYYKKEESINEFTKATNKDRSSYIFYLSALSPEEYIPKDLTEPFAVFKNEIKGTMDLNMFNRYLREEKYTIEQLLGIEPGFNDPYTYFKTNVVDFDFTSFKKENEQEVSEDDIKIINRVFEFLLPIFIKKQYTITINDWMENVNPDAELNEDWMYSFFLFEDDHHLDKNINIDYEEVKGFDPIYDRTKRWNKLGLYNKGATVIYDNSIDYSFYKEIEFGNIVCYNFNYYIYVGSEKYMLHTPGDGQDDYVNLPSSVSEWAIGTEIHNKEIVKYEGAYYIYLGRAKSSLEPPDSDDKFIEIDDISGDYPSYYKSNEFISDYNKYDYLIIDESENDGEIIYTYAWSKVNHNIVDYKNYGTYDKWERFGSNTVVDFPPIDNNLITGFVYRYLDNLYVYEGEIKPPYVDPLNDTSFKLLNFRPNSTPGESDFWTKITLEENKEDFSVIDRLILNDGLSEQQALEKISLLLDAVCVTSNKADWSSLSNKYIYLDFYGSENYDIGAEAIEVIDNEVTRPPYGVVEGNVIKFEAEDEQYHYIYCYEGDTVTSDIMLQNVVANNNSPFLALITDNWATSNYLNPENPTPWKLYIPINYKTIKIEFGNETDFNSVCDTIEAKLKECHIIDDPNEIITATVQYQNIDSYLASFEPFRCVLISAVEQPGQEETPKDQRLYDIEFRIVRKYVFEKLDNYFRIYSKPEETFEESPYIKIQYDFVKQYENHDDWPIPEIQPSGEYYNPDPDNAYYIFPHYFVSPRYRYDFQNVSFTQQVYEFANRRNYITEFYPSTHFALKRILNKDVFEPAYDLLKFTDIYYKINDEFDKEKLYPKLANNFSFKNTEQKCYEEFYKDKAYKDFNVFAAENNEIFIDLKKSNSPFHIGEKILFNLVGTDTYSYFFEGRILDIERETKSGVDCIKLTSSFNIPQGIELDYGILRTIDEKIYDIESVESGEIKVKRVFLDNNYIIPKPTVKDTVETFEELLEYPGDIEENDVIEVLDDENYFGKTTCYQWKNDKWNFVFYTKIIVYVNNSTETIKQECDVLSSEPGPNPNPEDPGFNEVYDTITINHPEILDNFVSGKIVLSKNIWRLKDYFRVMNEYLLAGKTLYDFSGTCLYYPFESGLLYDGTARF